MDRWNINITNASSLISKKIYSDSDLTFSSVLGLSFSETLILIFPVWWNSLVARQICSWSISGASVESCTAFCSSIWDGTLDYYYVWPAWYDPAWVWMLDVSRVSEVEVSTSKSLVPFSWRHELIRDLTQSWMEMKLPAESTVEKKQPCIKYLVLW